jgi:hypothetical protein
MAATTATTTTAMTATTTTTTMTTTTTTIDGVSTETASDSVDWALVGGAAGGAALCLLLLVVGLVICVARRRKDQQPVTATPSDRVAVASSTPLMPCSSDRSMMSARDASYVSFDPVESARYQRDGFGFATPATSAIYEVGTPAPANIATPTPTPTQAFTYVTPRY